MDRRQRRAIEREEQRERREEARKRVADLPANTGQGPGRRLGL